MVELGTTLGYAAADCKHQNSQREAMCCFGP